MDNLFYRQEVYYFVTTDRIQRVQKIPICNLWQKKNMTCGTSCHTFKKIDLKKKKNIYYSPYDKFI